ncbi:MAG: Nif3-like dinuclear metal center hexameric protein [Planctomycetota bacterium]
MISLDEACRVLAQIAPLRLAESWDNVGLLVGDRRGSISRVITCLTITPSVVAEAMEQSADLIVAHHPLPFKPLQRITSDTTTGRMLLELIRSGVAIYSAHTAFDSAAGGINQMWAERLQLTNTRPLIPESEEEPVDTDSVGSGRYGVLTSKTSLQQLARNAAGSVGAKAPRLVGSADQHVQKVALACGSGGSFLSAAKRRGCDVMVTGEATFHTCLEAEASEIGLVLLGHYWSERFAMESLAEELGRELAGLTVWASREERDPVAAVAQKH